MPPDRSDGGKATVTSAGYLYGHNCSTGGIYVPISGRGGCASPLFKQISSLTNATHRVSSYKITVEKNPPGGAVVFLLTFSQPVTLQSVLFSGAV